MLILPAIDIRNGKCVRLHQGDYSRETIYGENPAEVAQQFASEGAPYIHLVDLDGAKHGEPVNLDVIREIRRTVNVPLELGGGVRSLDSIQLLLDIGIDRVILGTILVKDPSFRREALARYGEKIVAGIDAKNGLVAVAGWEQTSDQSALSLALEMEREGARRFIVTDIATDGTLNGPNLPFLKEFTSNLNSAVIASGGIGSMQDMFDVAAIEPKVEGTIVGKAIYENIFSVRDAVSVFERSAV